MSKVEDEVCDIIQTRAKKVQATDKYAGATMERDDLTHDEWLEHLQRATRVRYQELSGTGMGGKTTSGMLMA